MNSLKKLKNFITSRPIIFAAGSFIINVAFAAYNGVLGALMRSLWFGALASYYVVLIILRGGVLVYSALRGRAVRLGRDERTLKKNDLTQYGVCGALLTLLPVCLSFAILLTVRDGFGFEHRGLTIYVFALYAFVKIIAAIVTAVKTRRTDRLPARALRCINLADAFVSILALQTAMFKEFATADGEINVAVMNAATGGVVCALTAALGVFMIVNAVVRIRKLKSAEPPETDEE